MPVDLTVCSICSGNITDELLQNRFCQPEHPEIPLGPYCSSCLSKVRVCSGCQHPFEIDRGITYFGKGRYYCDGCAENIEACGVCGSEGAIAHVIDGKKWCSDCYHKEYRKCDCCGEHKPKGDVVNNALKKAQYRGLFKKYNTVCGTCFSKNKARFKKYDVKECPNCQHLHSEKGEYCTPCWDTFLVCTSCGRKDHKVDTILVSAKNGKKSRIPRCPSCLTKYKTCSSCGAHSRFTKKSGTVLREAEVCPTCVKDDVEQCSSCLEMTELLKSGTCHNCSSKYRRNVCDECGRLKDDDGRCRVCGDSRVYNYGKKPHPKFHHTKKDRDNFEKLFFGIENEVHFSSGPGFNEALKDLYKEYGPDFLLTKDDSSIRSPGFEIVTQPMTLNHFQERDLSAMFHNTLSLHSSCGMHVHVSREAFHSDLHIFKVVEFIHDQVKNVDKVVGRSYNGYNEDIRKKASTTVKDAKKGQANRGARVNLTNKKTIEFRMFAMAETEYKLRYRVEWLHALVKWSAVSSISNAKSWKSLVKYIEAHKKQYPNIIKFLGEM